MKKEVIDRIDSMLVGEELKPLIEKEDEKGEKDEIDESILEPNEVGIKPGEYNNLSTGLRRIQFRLEKANTPQKYVDAFEVVRQLINKFPLKSKVIWQTVADSYSIRFGGTGIAADSVSLQPTVEEYPE